MNIQLQEQIDKIYGKEHTFSTLDEKTKLLLSMVNETYGNLENKARKNEILFEEAIHKSKLSEKAKSDFMANMSHEIRTPMNGIVGFTQLLLGGEVTEEQREFLELIEHSTSLLHKVVDNILDFSKIENGKLELDFIDINVFTDFYAVISLFKTEISEKNISYRVDIDPDISETLLMDELRITQILNNLISNAIKFTAKNGEILIEIHKLKSFENSELISFAVTDTGIGIKEDKLGDIFNSFIQADSSMSREFGGTGLGLSICQSLCELMDSKLNVVSTLGQGSTFSFEVLLEKSKSIKKLSSQTRESLIYVVEHMHRDCDYVIYQLEHFGINYKKVSLDEASEWDISNNIVIVFDYRVCSSLNLNDSKILLIDGRKETFPFVKNMIDIYHIDSFIEFPTEVYRAISKLNLMLKKKKKNQKFDLNVLVAEDNRVNRLVIDEMLSKYGIKADFAHDGIEAVQMGESLVYDLILMDINMPNLNGVEATKSLKDKGLTIPIIALTANVLKGDRERFLKLGLDDYISKPISIDALYSILYKYN